MKSKKVLSITIFLLFNSFMFSQPALKKGVYYLGGSIEFTTSKNTMNESFGFTSTVKETYLLFQPSFSYFIIDNLSIGTSVLYFYEETEISYQSSNNQKSIYRQLGIGPSIRYYFGGNNIVPFVGVGDSYSKSIDSEQENNMFTITGGIDYFLSKSIGLEPFLSYSIIHYTKPDQSINNFSIGLRINYFIIN